MILPSANGFLQGICFRGSSYFLGQPRALHATFWDVLLSSVDDVREISWLSFLSFLRGWRARGAADWICGLRLS
jgi:hypothetical protein